MDGARRHAAVPQVVSPARAGGKRMPVCSALGAQPCSVRVLIVVQAAMQLAGTGRSWPAGWLVLCWQRRTCALLCP